jgi:hypothetical protein
MHIFIWPDNVLADKKIEVLAFLVFKLQNLKGEGFHM